MPATTDDRTPRPWWWGPVWAVLGALALLCGEAVAAWAKEKYREAALPEVS